MRNYNHLLTLLALVPTLLCARVHEYETTHQKALAGAGVGSILLEEGNVLNPANLALFNISTVYLNTTSAEYKQDSNGYSESDDLKSVIVSDTKNSLKGSLGYQNITEGRSDRERFSLAMAKAVNQKSTMGVIARRTTDTINGEEDTYNQTVLGFTHIPSPEFSLGIIWVDPLRAKTEDHRVVAGIQYVYSHFISLLLDVGTDWKNDFTDYLQYKAGIQFKFYQDFFAKGGVFRDNYLQEKGSGLGVSWVGPRLGLAAALKVTKPTGESLSNISFGEEVRETSFSLSYIF